MDRVQISRALHAVLKTLDLVLLNVTLMAEGRTSIYCSLPCDKPSFRDLTWVISTGYILFIKFPLLIRNRDLKLF